MIPLVSPLVKYFNDPLRKNSLFLIGSHGMIALLGLLFWIIITRLAPGRLADPDEEIGIATALISAVLLLQIFSKLGFDIGLIRFLPSEKKKSDMINTCFTLAGLLSMVVALIFVLGLGVWSPALVFIREKPDYALLFVLYTVGATYVALLQGSVFVALRATQFSFIIQAVAGLRLLFVVGLISSGAFGIFSSWGLAGLVACAAGIFFLFRLQPTYRPVPVIKKTVIGNMLRFSLGNYIAESFKDSPGFLLPLLIVNVLEPEMSAYFYIAWTVATVLFMIPYGTCFSLLAEGSYQPERLRSDIVRAMKFALLLLIPAILVSFLFGEPILRLFRQEYAENAFSLLRVLALSGIPLLFNTLYITVKRVQRQIRPVIFIYAFVAAFTVGVGYALMIEKGLVGVGIAWAASQGLITLFIGLAMVKRMRLSQRSIAESTQV